MEHVRLAGGSSTTTPSASTYAGPAKELIVDTDLWAIRVQDGTTPGGHLLSPGSSPPVLMIGVTTGTTHTLSTLTNTRTQVTWSSTTAGAKTENIPNPALWDGYEIGVKVTVGDNSAFSIVPAAGTIDGAATLDFSDVPTLPRTNFMLRASAALNMWIVV
jgi:hypothetical protein